MGTIKIIKTVEEDVHFVPCILCGSEDINFYNMGYSSFNVGGAKCRNCGNEVKINGLDWNAPDSVVVPHWNHANDPEIVRKKIQSEIDKLQSTLDKLPKK